MRPPRHTRGRVPLGSALIPLVALVVCTACASPGARTVTPVIEVQNLVGIPDRYLPAFEALRDAVERQNDHVARGILERLFLRLEIEREDEALALADRIESGDQGDGPFLVHTKHAIALAENYATVLDGRERVAALRLALIQLPSENEGFVRLGLSAGSEHDAPLELRPGPATVRLRFTSVTPAGHESHFARELPATELRTIRVTPDETTVIDLGEFPIGLGPELIAGRIEWQLLLRSGEVREGGRGYPAMRIAVADTERTLLAAYLPAGEVDPEELASYVTRPGLARPPVMERAVRIAPERREEALDLLAPFIATAPGDALVPVIPALRWLARTSTPGRDPLEWKGWFEKREVSRRNSIRGRALQYGGPQLGLGTDAESDSPLDLGTAGS